MKFYRVSYNQYNVCCKIHNKNILVATIRTPLIGMDRVFLNMYFPYEDSVERTIKMQYLTEKEMLENARRIIAKNMYKMSSDILSEINTTGFDDEKYKRKFTIGDNFAHGNVYAEKQ